MILEEDYELNRNIKLIKETINKLLKYEAV